MPMGDAVSPDQRNRARVSFLLAALAALALVALALLTLRTGGAHALDGRLLFDLNRRDRGTVHSLAELLRLLGEAPAQIALLAVAVAIGLSRGLVDRAVAAVVLVIGANLTTQILKHLIVDRRYGPVAQLFPVAEHTFPSGHATTMTALTFAYLLVVPARLRPAVAVLGAVLTLLVGSAMVVLHRHWPSDAVGGVLVGCFWGFGAIAVLARRR